MWSDMKGMCFKNYQAGEFNSIKTERKTVHICPVPLKSQNLSKTRQSIVQMNDDETKSH